MKNNSKVAIVTGASSGIGYATSLALSKDGIRMALTPTPIFPSALQSKPMYRLPSFSKGSEFHLDLWFSISI